MHVPFAHACCPSCGSVFQTGTAVVPAPEAVEITLSRQRQDRKPIIFPATPVLHSWKDISSYLGLGVRTAQRWEHDLGLPVHRPSARERAAVIAFPDELDAWLRRSPVKSQPEPHIVETAMAHKSCGRWRHENRRTLH